MVADPASGFRLPMRVVAALLFALLLIGAVAALLVTRELRRQDDVVSSVRLTHRIAPTETREASARIRFRLTGGPQSTTVQIVDRSDGVVRTLVDDEQLLEGRHDLSWDGRTDADVLADPGRYRVRILLTDKEREIVTPDSIRVRPPQSIADQLGEA